MVKEILSQREKNDVYSMRMFIISKAPIIYYFRCNLDPVCIGFVFDTTADQNCKAIHVGGGEFVSNDSSDVFSKKQGTCTKANGKIRQ